mgnify:CR=1 FL=1
MIAMALLTHVSLREVLGDLGGGEVSHFDAVEALADVGDMEVLAVAFRQATPAQVVGEHKTVQGATVKVTGTPDSLKVNDAGVVCGGVATTNAQVYLIDTVLMPPAQ